VKFQKSKNDNKNDGQFDVSWPWKVLLFSLFTFSWSHSLHSGKQHAKIFPPIMCSQCSQKSLHSL